jgi:hypothetical protein
MASMHSASNSADRIDASSVADFSVHLPVVSASFSNDGKYGHHIRVQMFTIEGGTTTVAARNRRPHTRRTVDPRLNFTITGTVLARADEVVE